MGVSPTSTTPVSSRRQEIAFRLTERLHYDTFSYACSERVVEEEPILLNGRDSEDRWYSDASDPDTSYLTFRESSLTVLNSDCPQTVDSTELSDSNDISSVVKEETRSPPAPCFRTLRFAYLSVILVIFLADGLQGTHLYKLYDGYGFSVASLYCLGFFTGGTLSPLTGPWVDKVGRKRAAITYCVLEAVINFIEGFPYITCLIASRVIGGFTTNLLQVVFETWLDAEFRKEKFSQLKQVRFRNHEERLEFEKAQQHAYELLMRDAVIVSNAAAIGSGYLSHILALMAGPVGPFHGAVVCTLLALAVVSSMWTENYGGSHEDSAAKSDAEPCNPKQSVLEFLQQATEAFMTDMKMLRVGIVQGLSVGCLQIFVFLWSPILIELAKVSKPTWGLDRNGEPAFGLIFMMYMAACVLGGLIAPLLRQGATAILTPFVAEEGAVVPSEVPKGATVRPMAVEFLAALCYLVAAGMLAVPCLVSGPDAFSHTLLAFCIYEFIVGIVSPCEGVIRSIYFPAHSRASVWTLPSLLINTAVSLAVFGTQFVSFFFMCSVVVVLMVSATSLQISLISAEEWVALKAHVHNIPRFARRFSSRLFRQAEPSSGKRLRRFSYLTASTIDSSIRSENSEAIIRQLKEAKEKLE